jgi:hypothetical protein
MNLFSYACSGMEACLQPLGVPGKLGYTPCLTKLQKVATFDQAEEGCYLWSMVVL